MDKVREGALQIVYQVFEKGSYTSISLNKRLKGSSYTSLERRFLTELAYGTIRNSNTLFWILGKHLKKQNLAPWIKYILLLGIYQIMYMDKVPDSAACNESVELAKKYGNIGSVKLVNAVLRNVSRNKEKIEFPSIEEDPVDHISIKYSFPSWLIKRWYERFGLEDTVKLCVYFNEEASVAIRTNTLKISRNELKKKLEEEGIESKESNICPDGLIVSFVENSVFESTAFKKGLFLAQSESSQLVARIVSPSEKALIIDACAAPGVKTTHLAQLVNDKAFIKAFDIHDHKIKLIRKNCDRLGINCVESFKKDARLIKQDYNEMADFLLLDVPCTETGVLRKPDIRWKKEEYMIKEVAELQLELLSQTSLCVKRNGVIVYSTCSINQEENLDIIEKFLNKNPQFKLEPLLDYCPQELIRDSEDLDSLKNGFIQLLPQKHRCDGFFISRLRRM